ncbi:MAG: TonB-dependent receptor [Algibacter sp.]
MKTLKILVILFIGLSSAVGFAQQVIEGIVIDENKEPLPGVSIVIKGTEQGTTTDITGRFRIDVKDESAILVFSYLGFENIEQTVTPRIEVVMIESSEQLDAVTVQGFATVTGRARKRRENVQSIPEAITAISGEQLESQGTSNIGDMLSKISNVSFNNYQDVGNFTINIRGITSVRNGELPVSIVVDDIQLSVTEQLISDFYDIEQIEVLKGPQGTLYGRNAIGGAINYTTKQPSNTLKGKIKATYATGNDIKLLGSVSGAIAKDKLYGSLAASYRNFDGYENQRNTFLDELTNESREFSLRGQLIADVSPSVTLTLRGQVSDLEGGAYAYIQTPDNGTGADNFEGRPQANLLGSSELNTADINFKAEFKTDIGRLLAISSYADGEYTSRGDLDHTSTPILWQFADRKFNAFNQEIRLVSKEYKGFNYVAGIFYQNKETTPLFQAGLDDGVTGFDGVSFPASISENTNKTFAVFAQTNISLAEKLELTAGLRLDNDNREQDDQTNNVFREERFTQLQPKVGLTYKPSKSTIVYGNYAVGYRSGGFNAPRSTDITVTNPSQFAEDFDKEVTKNIEFGIKNTLLNNRLILNASFFRTNFENEQVYVVDLGTVTTGIFNLEEVVNQGFEIEAKYRVTNSLDFGFNYGFIDSDIKQADIASQFAQEDGTTGGSWEGNSAPFVSDNSFTLFADFHVKNFSLYADLNRLGDFYWHPDNFDVQEPYSLVNAKATYSFGDIALSVYGNNIFSADYNQEYFSKEFSTAPLDLRYPSAPNVFGVELLYKF